MEIFNDGFVLRLKNEIKARSWTGCISTWNVSIPLNIHMTSKPIKKYKNFWGQRQCGSNFDNLILEIVLSLSEMSVR